MTTQNPAAVSLGARGGKAKSAAKRKAAKVNGGKGGRPKQFLAEDIQCVGVHGVTGQEYEEGTLEAGARVRGLDSSVDEYDQRRVWTFLASSDGGRTWYRQRAYNEPKLTTERP